MKFIPYKKFKETVDEVTVNEVDTLGIVAMYLNDARQGGATYEEMRDRIELLDKIRALEPKDGAEPPSGIMVDKDEYALLKGILTYRFPWGANRQVFEILTDIRDAKAP